MHSRDQLNMPSEWPVADIPSFLFSKTCRRHGNANMGEYGIIFT